VITREAIEYPATANVLVDAWRAALAAVRDVGRATTLIGQALAGAAGLGRARARRALVEQMFTVGIRSLPIITVVGMFTGMILALQTGLELRRYNQEVYIGSAVMVSLLREMGPFMTGLILSASVGSSMAAQLGTMTVNDEIAALETMSIDPVRFLMTPRLLAMAIMMPLLSFYNCLVGVLGGGLVGMTQLNVAWSQYIATALEFARTKDLYVGLFKALLFGLIIAGVSCYEGFTTTQGAVGVGQSTRRSVITSFLLILVVGYFVTRFFYIQ
jgi:phospholipid/cholesterol/gamma-HCH transport system permease protein